VNTWQDYEYNDLLALSRLSVEEVKRLWDEYDGCNCPGGVSGEMIHHHLNAHGEGAYCAV